ISGNFHDHPLKSDSVQIVAFAYSSNYPCELSETTEKICSDEDSTGKVKCPVKDYKKTMTVQ
ncbi:4232_t:CDS:2, partial [Acaulospora colombiana]